MKILLHLDELFLKGNNQSFFCKKMLENLRALFPRAEVKRTESGSMLMDGVEAENLEQLSLVPGIATLAPAESGGRDLEEIKKLVDKLEFSENTKTFRVTASRSDKKYPLSSNEIDCAIGGYVAEKYGLKVNLKNANMEIRVDIGAREAVVYNNVIRGAGGLPTGSSGKVICLVSGGIDSPVAAYRMMKRGAEVALIHFQNETKSTEEVSQKIIDLARVLARYQPSVKLIIVPFAEFQKQVVMKVPAKYRMIITRRLMFKISENLAREEKCLAITTGDSLGQVASQTLENLTAVYEATALLKLAPLMGDNKSEIMNLARRIGTLGISERPYEDCCSLFVAKHPETRAKLADVLKIEQAAELSTVSLDKSNIISYYISID